MNLNQLHLILVSLHVCMRYTCVTAVAPMAPVTLLKRVGGTYVGLIYANRRTNSPLAPKAFCHPRAAFRALWLAHILQSNSTTTGSGAESRERELYCDREQEQVGGKGKRRGERGLQRRREVA